MSKKSYLVCDFGASNGRTVLARFDGNRFEMDAIHRFENRPVYASGILYWDILRLFSEIKIGLGESIKKYGRVESIGVDTWGADFAFIDKKGELIANPVSYRDRERHEVTPELFNKILPEKRLFELTGSSVTSVFDLSQLYAFVKNRSFQLEVADSYLAIPDIFNYLLTGNKYNEFSKATTSILFNQKKEEWEEHIITRLGISRDLFCEIIYPGQKAGDLTTDIKEEMGITDNISVIAPATHDTASAVAGIPVMDMNKNWVFMSIGTWCCGGMEGDNVIINDSMFENNIFNLGLVEGLHSITKNITGLWVIQQCRQGWMKDKNRDISWNEIVDLSLEAPMLKTFIDTDDPVFALPNIKMDKVIMDYCRDKKQDIPEGIGAISRCIYESLAMKFKLTFNIFEKVTGKKIDCIYLVGGGIQNETLCQWTADATGKNVFAGPIEATSAGNLIMQLKADGEISSLEEGRQISRNSNIVKNYEPGNTEIWDKAFSDFLNVID